MFTHTKPQYNSFDRIKRKLFYFLQLIIIANCLLVSTNFYNNNNKQQTNNNFLATPENVENLYLDLFTKYSRLNV